MIQRAKPALAGKIETGSEPPLDGGPHDAFEDMAVIEYHLFFAAKTRFQSFGADAKNIGVDELFKTKAWKYKKG